MSQNSVATAIAGNNYEGTLQDFLNRRPPGSEWVQTALVEQNGRFRFRKDPILESPGLLQYPGVIERLSNPGVSRGLGAGSNQPNRVRVEKEGNRAKIVERIYGNNRYNVESALNAVLSVTGTEREQQRLRRRMAANAEAAELAQTERTFSPNERRRRRNANRAIRGTFGNQRGEIYERVAARMPGRNIQIANMLATPELFQSLLLEAAYNKRLTSEDLRVKKDLKAIENLANTEQTIRELNSISGGLISEILKDKKVNKDIFNEIRKTEAFKTLRSQLNDRLQELLAYLTSPYNLSNQAERERRGAALAEFLALPYEFANQFRILIVEQMTTLVPRINQDSRNKLMSYADVLRRAGNDLVTTLVQRVPGAARQIRSGVRRITGTIRTNPDLQGAIVSALQAGIAAGSLAAMTGNEGAVGIAGAAAASRAAMGIIRRLKNYAVPLMRAYMFPPVEGGEAANGSNRSNRSVLTNKTAFYDAVNTLSLPSGAPGGSQNYSGFTPQPSPQRSLSLHNVAAAQAAAAQAAARLQAGAVAQNAQFAAAAAATERPRKRAKTAGAGPSRVVNSNQEGNN